MKPRNVVALTAVIALTVLACTADEDAAGEDGLDVMAAMYPLEFLAEEVGGEHVSVTALTPAGVDPHDLELSTATVMDLDGAVVLYLSGFQPAVDDALAVTDPARVLDVAETARVTAFDEDGPSETGPVDPHFWQDPERMADVADAVAAELSDLDPDHAADFSANAERLRDELIEIDEAYAAELANCEVRTVVAAHEAYGYLADRYDLDQVGISGLDPEGEPSPARLAEVRRVVESSGVSTIFAEQLINPAVAESFASDLGIDVALLDPGETEADDGDFLDAMRNNLDALTAGLGCS